MSPELNTAIRQADIRKMAYLRAIVDEPSGRWGRVETHRSRSLDSRLLRNRALTTYHHLKAAARFHGARFVVQPLMPRCASNLSVPSKRGPL
jgi:hypothetical protein